MHREHLDAQLPQEVEVGLLLARGLHAQPPGIHCADAETPSVEGKPPLLDPERHPVKE